MGLNEEVERVADAFEAYNTSFDTRLDAIIAELVTSNARLTSLEADALALNIVLTAAVSEAVELNTKIATLNTHTSGGTVNIDRLRGVLANEIKDKLTNIETAAIFGLLGVEDRTDESRAAVERVRLQLAQLVKG